MIYILNGEEITTYKNIEEAEVKISDLYSGYYLIIKE